MSELKTKKFNDFIEALPPPVNFHYALTASPNHVLYESTSRNIRNIVKDWVEVLREGTIEECGLSGGEFEL